MFILAFFMGKKNIFKLFGELNNIVLSLIYQITIKSKHMKNSTLKIGYSTLSGYTIAKNCCDISDVNFGLNELKSFVRDNYPANCKLAFKRIIALEKKKNKLINK
jgi:hypothetical protein